MPQHVAPAADLGDLEIVHDLSLVVVREEDVVLVGDFEIVQIELRLVLLVLVFRHLLGVVLPLVAEHLVTREASNGNDHVAELQVTVGLLY